MKRVESSGEFEFKKKEEKGGREREKKYRSTIGFVSYRD